MNNTNEEIKAKVLLNIEHSLKYINNKYDNIIITRNQILINKRIHKNGKN